MVSLGRTTLQTQENETAKRQSMRPFFTREMNRTTREIWIKGDAPSFQCVEESYTVSRPTDLYDVLPGQLQQVCPWCTWIRARLLQMMSGAKLFCGRPDTELNQRSALRSLYLRSWWRVDRTARSGFVKATVGHLVVLPWVTNSEKEKHDHILHVLYIFIIGLPPVTFRDIIDE